MNRKNILFVFVVLMIGGWIVPASSVSAQIPPAQSVQDEDSQYIPGAIYVKFKDRSLNLPKGGSRYVPVSALFPQKSSLKAFGMHSEAYSLRMDNEPRLEQVFRIDFDSIGKTDAFIKSLEKDSRIELIERVPQVTIQWEMPAKSEKEKPNDPFYNTMIGILNPSWHLDMVGFAETYGKYTGNKEIKSAIVDNAVWGAHEDLQIDTANLYDVYNRIAGKADPESYIGHDGYGDPDNPSPSYIWSHGTHCAGMLGAITDNNVGIASFASGVTLMGIRASDPTGNNLNSAIQGVAWAAENGAKLISMSYGATAQSSVEGMYYSSFVKQGVVLVAAAGNSSSTNPEYPANYEGVISVGSVNSDGQRSLFSNTGSWIDVWAPGGYLVNNGVVDNRNQIFSTTYCSTEYYTDIDELYGLYYDAMVGTSMATPLVSSIASLILSYYPDLNGYQMKEILQQASQRGYVYAPDAFAFLENSAALEVRNLSAAWNPQSKLLEMKWDAPETPGVESYEIYFNESSIGTSDQTVFRAENIEDTAGFFGVKAVYSDCSSLTRYVHVEKDQTLSSSQMEKAVGDIRVTVDARNREVILHTGETFDRIEVYNIMGVKVGTFPGTSKVLRLDDRYPQGLFIGRAVKGNVSGVFKFVL